MQTIEFMNGEKSALTTVLNLLNMAIDEEDIARIREYCEKQIYFIDKIVDTELVVMEGGV